MLFSIRTIIVSLTCSSLSPRYYFSDLFLEKSIFRLFCDVLQGCLFIVAIWQILGLLDVLDVLGLLGLLDVLGVLGSLGLLCIGVIRVTRVIRVIRVIMVIR